MAAPMLSPPIYRTPTSILEDLMLDKEEEWMWTSSGSSMYPTNPPALHYAIELNEFRLREVDNIVVLGLRGLGTVEQLCANYNDQWLSDDQKHIQKVAITQLQMVLIIRNHIQTVLRNHAEVRLYICDHDLDESMKPALQGLELTIFGLNQLSNQINRNTLIYDVAMHPTALRGAVDFSWGESVLPPAAVITHMNSLLLNGAGLDVDILAKYWVSPLMEFTPSVVVSKEMFEAMASRPDRQLPYDQWVEQWEQQSLKVSIGYFDDACTHQEDMEQYREYAERMNREGKATYIQKPTPRSSWICDPMMVILCRKDSQRPTITSEDSEPHCISSQQQQQHYQQAEEDWGIGESWVADESEGAAEHGGSSNVSYASMPGPHGHGVMGSHDGGAGQY